MFRITATHSFDTRSSSSEMLWAQVVWNKISYKPYTRVYLFVYHGTGTGTALKSQCLISIAWNFTPDGCKMRHSVSHAHRLKRIWSCQQIEGRKYSPIKISPPGPYNHWDYWYKIHVMLWEIQYGSYSWSPFKSDITSFHTLDTPKTLTGI